MPTKFPSHVMLADKHAEKIETCQQALDAWNAGHAVPTIDISGLGGGYEYACQRLMFTAISEQIEHAGRSQHWDNLRESGVSTYEVFKDAADLADAEGMTGAQFGESMDAAVVFLVNDWSRAFNMIPDARKRVAKIDHLGVQL